MSPRKRDERLKRVYEAKVKEEQREEEKKKKIEQKMAQIDEKNDKVSNKSDYNLSVHLDIDLPVCLTLLISPCSVMRRKRPKRRWP